MLGPDFFQAVRLGGGNVPTPTADGTSPGGGTLPGAVRGIGPSGTNADPCLCVDRSGIGSVVCDELDGGGMSPYVAEPSTALRLRGGGVIGELA